MTVTITQQDIKKHPSEIVEGLKTPISISPVANAPNSHPIKRDDLIGTTFIFVPSLFS